MDSNALAAEAIELASLTFDQMVQERHAMGAEKYGPVKFLTIDSIEMALEELADLANYTRYTFIKLYLLRLQLEKNVPQQRPPTLGVGAVINPNGR